MIFKKEPQFKMSDTSGPHRMEVRESKVGEMKAELFHIRVRNEQIMGMTQQLLQVKSADGVQQEKKSGGSGRVDANDGNGGAGRTPREEGAAGTRVAATTETATGGKMSSLSSRASDGSRPADGTGRRPEVPAGVGPMINIQHGEARDSFLAGIAAHDGDGDLSSGTAPCCAPCDERRERIIPKIQT